MELLKVVVNLLILIVGCAWGDGGRVRVNSGTGQVDGLLLQSDGGHDFWAFRGIPYAKPPVGQLRFQPPEAAESWENVLDATGDAPSCLQVEFMTSFVNPRIEGDEDCLYLNVYTPPFKQKDDLRAVMVYVHGGGFACGNGSSILYGPHRFMDKDVVLVTINYRLGVFGFLSTADSASPGNYGLMDQTLALRWVQQYIKNFGGDPERVTLFGQSAGGASTSLHMLLPNSKGLIHSNIQQSGNAISSWVLRRQPLKMAKEFAEEVECSTETTQELVDCLKQKTATDLIQASLQMLIKNSQKQEILFGFAPVIDGDFLPADPRQLVMDKKFVNPVPTLSGFNEDEGSFLYYGMLGGVSEGTMNEQDLGKMITKLVSYIIDSKDVEVDVKLHNIFQILFAQLSETDENDLQKQLSIISKIISVPIDIETDVVNELMTAAGIDVYPYKFSYIGQNSILQKADGYYLLEKKYGTDAMSNIKLVTHGDELNYLFRCAYVPSTQLDDQDSRMSDVILNLWTNFAKYRKPTVDGSWKPTTIKKPSYFNINLEPQEISDYLSNYYQLWKDSEKPKEFKTEL